MKYWKKILKIIIWLIANISIIVNDFIQNIRLYFLIKHLFVKFLCNIIIYYIKLNAYRLLKGIDIELLYARIKKRVANHWSVIYYITFLRFLKILIHIVVWLISKYVFNNILYMLLLYCIVFLPLSFGYVLNIFILYDFYKLIFFLSFMKYISIKYFSIFKSYLPFRLTNKLASNINNNLNAYFYVYFILILIMLF